MSYGGPQNDIVSGEQYRYALTNFVCPSESTQPGLFINDNLSSVLHTRKSNSSVSNWKNKNDKSLFSEHGLAY